MIFVFLFFCSFLFVDGFADIICSGSKQKHKTKCVLSFLLLISFYAFRGLSVLNDTSHYYESQQELIESGELNDHFFIYYDILNRFEPGFQVFQRFIAQYIWDNPYAIILFSAIIISFSLVYIAQYHTEHIGFAIFFLLQLGGAMGQFTAIRQAFAVIVFYFIMELCIKKKRIYAILLVPFAMLFHKYAFVLLVPVLLSYFKASKIKIILISIIAYVLMALLSGIIDMLGFGNSRYVDESFDHTPLAVIVEVLTTIMVAYICIILKKQYKVEPINDLFIWVFVLSIICSLYSMSIPIFTRFQLYFKPYIALFLIYYLDRVSHVTRTRVVFFLATILLANLLIVLIFRNEWSHMVPYSFFDFTETNPETQFGY